MAFAAASSGSACSIPDVTGMDSYTVLYFLRTPSSIVTDHSAMWFDNYPTSPRNAAGLKLNNGSGQTRFEAYVGDTGGVKDSTLLSANTNYAIAMWRSGTTARFYVDGAQFGTDLTVASGSFTAENIRLGCHYYSGANNEFSSSIFSEFAIYSAALTTDEIAAHAKFVAPTLIRPASLIRYAPLIRSRIERKAGVTVTDIGSPAVADHPRVIYPRSRQARKFTYVAPASSTIGLLRANAGLGGGPFSLANAGVGAIA